MTRAQAGRRGGRSTAKKYGPDYMRELGRKGAAAFWRLYSLRPIGLNDFAIVYRATGEPTGRTMNGRHLPPH